MNQKTFLYISLSLYFEYVANVYTAVIFFFFLRQKGLYDMKFWTAEVI